MVLTAAAAPTLALAAARPPGFALLFLKKTQEPLRVFLGSLIASRSDG